MHLIPFNIKGNISSTVSAAVPAALAAALPLFSGDTSIELLRSIL